MTTKPTSRKDTLSTAEAIQRLEACRPPHQSRFDAKSKRPAVRHAWDTREVDALQVALVTRRPLLLRGEPGCGKTQLAAAVAHELGWALHALTVHPRMEPHEVCYRFDAIARLADAQRGNAEDVGTVSRHYEPGPLWWALDYKTAQHMHAARNPAEASVPVPAGHVVLIDEIDKADSDLPNSLLELFGERSLGLPCAPHQLKFPPGEQLQPLILLTTNEDREPPAPFLRRCVVLNVEVRASDPQWLVERRARAHFSNDSNNPDGLPYLAESVMFGAAKLLASERTVFEAATLSPPGVAEYLDLLQALHALQAQQNWTDDALMEQIGQLSRFVYRKHGGPNVPNSAQQWSERGDAQDGQAQGST